jgi:WD40 repeat protein
MGQAGKLKDEEQIHQGSILDLQMSKDGTHFVTAGYDNNAQLVDTETLEVLKVYPFGAHANSAALSPIFDHVWAVLVGLLGYFMF